MTRIAAIAELKTELSYSRKVYRNVPGKKERFIESKKQERYDVMKGLLEALGAMTDAEFNKFTQRAARKEKDAAQQPPTLF